MVSGSRSGQNKLEKKGLQKTREPPGFFAHHRHSRKIHHAGPGCKRFYTDLDFGTALALTHASGPSVLQVRGQHILPDVIADMVRLALKQFEAAIREGALLVVDAARSRVRVLPL